MSISMSAGTSSILAAVMTFGGACVASDYREQAQRLAAQAGRLDLRCQDVETEVLTDAGGVGAKGLDIGASGCGRTERYKISCDWVTDCHILEDPTIRTRQRHVVEGGEAETKDADSSPPDRSACVSACGKDRESCKAACGSSDKCASSCSQDYQACVGVCR